MDTDPLIQILARLSEHGVEYVLIGGMAAIVHGSGVVTEDVDVCAPLTLANLQRIVAALNGLNPRFRFHPSRPALHDDPATLIGFKNLNLVTDWGVIDILGDLPGVGAYADLAGRTVETSFGKTRCRMLDLDTLIAAKRTAGRPKDLIGVRHLEVLKKYREQNPGLSDDM